MRTPRRTAAPARRRTLLSLPPAAVPGAAKVGPLSLIWPFPSVIVSAFLIAWGAECAQFWMSRGMALAILAWLQAMPEFAVEAVIAWSQHVHYMTANLTGSLRLLVGLGWPLIFAVAAVSTWRRERRLLRRIDLDPENCVEVVALAVPVLYFLVVYAKDSLTLVDGAILLAIYVGYLAILRRVPPRDPEHIEDLESIPRRVMRLPRRPQMAAIIGLFVVGGVLLWGAADPFLKSMLRLAATLGVSEYLFIQWVAPFLSEFPEKLSAIYWARQKGKSPMALMNMVSANINQWTMLAAMIPVVYSLSAGKLMYLPLDDYQRREILLTVAQSLLGVLLLLNMSFHLREAAGIFVLWFAQFIKPDLHVPVTIVYLAWSALEVVLLVAARRRVPAFAALADLLRRGAPPGPPASARGAP